MGSGRPPWAAGECLHTFKSLQETYLWCVVWMGRKSGTDFPMSVFFIHFLFSCHTQWHELILVGKDGEKWHQILYFSGTPCQIWLSVFVWLPGGKVNVFPWSYTRLKLLQLFMCWQTYPRSMQGRDIPAKTWHKSVSTNPSK